MFLGLRTVIYPAPDLEASKAWFTARLGFGPYFDQPFYVGFSVGGYELGLDPNADVAGGAVGYWGVDDLDATLAELVAAGASPRTGIDDVGDGIKVASVVEPGGGVLGLIENPHFAVVPVEGSGPGR
jgi:catechol 2,3-dioxygenase-like lactoylglutathione lyase family enzyme